MRFPTWTKNSHQVDATQILLFKCSTQPCLKHLNQFNIWNKKSLPLICWYSWMGPYWGQLLYSKVFVPQSNSPPGIKVSSSISTFCIRPSCANSSLELPPSRNECRGTEGMGSKRYNWLSKILASRARKSIERQNFYHTWNWISHFALEKQFTRDGVRMLGWCGHSRLISWGTRDAGSIMKNTRYDGWAWCTRWC